MLESALKNRRWLWQDSPLPFVTASNVFTDKVYDDIVRGFREVMARGLLERGKTEENFTRSMSGYDAYCFIVTRKVKGPLELFMSPEWHALFKNLFGVEINEDVSLALHHHKPGGASGRPHNDLNPGWFVDREPGDTSLNIQDPSVNAYQSDKVFAPGRKVHESIRAIAMLFYLDNPPWKPGDGGETGLYRSAGVPAEDAIVRVPPTNNSLLAFECTPYSYHGYVKNTRNARNSVIMWFHRSKDEVVRRWGSHSIVGWNR